jgi:hypothetical protein
VSYNFFGPLSVGIAPVFNLRRNGINQFAFALNATLFVSLPLGAGVSFVGVLLVQTALLPEKSIALVPLGGLSFKLVGT